jgi:hypothetical protein
MAKSASSATSAATGRFAAQLEDETKGKKVQWQALTAFQPRVAY